MDFFQTPSFHVSFWWLCDLCRGEAAWNKGSKQMLKCQDARAVTALNSNPENTHPCIPKSIDSLSQFLKHPAKIWNPTLLQCLTATHFVPLHQTFIEKYASSHQTCLELAAIILGPGTEIQFEKIWFSLCLFHTMPILAIYQAKFWHWQFFALY